MPHQSKSFRAASLKQEFLRFAGKERLFSKNSKILLAVSGGVDSMVMLHLFQSSGIDIGVAHCNFGLRGIESGQDQSFVKETCKENQVDFYTRRFPTREYARRGKISVQMAARELRYSWFEKVRAKHNYDFIATAHHKDDAVESLLMNLIRGTGATGLGAIDIHRGFVIRPLLFARKKELMHYAVENSLLWREDKSNLEVKYERNLLRNKVIPDLYKRNAGLGKILDQIIKKGRRVKELMHNYASIIREEFLRVMGEDLVLDKSVKSVPYAIPVISELLRDFGFNYTQVKDIVSKPHSPGTKFYSENYYLVVDRHIWIISRKQIQNFKKIRVNKNTRTRKTLNGQFHFQREPGSVKINPDSNLAQLDFGKLTFPLEIRLWKTGDRFQPLGMRGKKKISDLMIDEKIPVNLKSRVKVLISGDEIAWVVGIRISDRYKITPQSKESYIVKYVSYDESI